MKSYIKLKLMYGFHAGTFLLCSLQKIACNIMYFSDLHCQTKF